jgi:hypothetical protein
VDPILVITNSDSGGSDDHKLESALATLRSHTSIEIASTSFPGELDGALHRAGSRRIAVAGDERMLHAVIAALYRRHELSGKVLGFLPVGSVNGFATRHGIPTDLDQAARVVAQGTPQQVDLIIDELGGVVVDSVTIDAHGEPQPGGDGLLERIGSLGVGPVRLADLGRPVGAVFDALAPAYLRLRIEVDGQVVTDVDQALAGVKLACAHPAEASPGRGPSSGGIELTITPITTATSGNLLQRVGSWSSRALGLGRRSSDEPVRGTTIRVSGQEFWCHHEGRTYGPERQRTWRVEPSAYNLLQSSPDSV